METMIPYLMALAGFFLINKDRSNRIVTVLFVFFYSLNLLFNMTIAEGPNIYLVELVLITAFFVAVFISISVFQIKVTMMILVLCATDIIIASMDIVSFVAYNNKVIYAAAYDGIIQLAIIQYAALWVNDARRVKLGSHYDNIRLRIRDIALRSLYR